MRTAGRRVVANVYDGAWVAPTLSIAPGDRVHITIVNHTDEKHPFHLHTYPMQAISITGVPQPFNGYQDTMNFAAFVKRGLTQSAKFGLGAAAGSGRRPDRMRPRMGGARCRAAHRAPLHARDLVAADIVAPTPRSGADA